jgi:hypothetical protein
MSVFIQKSYKIGTFSGEHSSPLRCGTMIFTNGEIAICDDTATGEDTASPLQVQTINRPINCDLEYGTLLPAIVCCRKLLKFSGSLGNKGFSQAVHLFLLYDFTLYYPCFVKSQGQKQWKEKLTARYMKVWQLRLVTYRIMVSSECTKIRARCGEHILSLSFCNLKCYWLFVLPSS